MTRLSPTQKSLVQSITGRLAAIPGVEAVVLGGSYARGFDRPGSDIDLGVFYSEASPFEIDRVRELAGSLNDTPGSVVSGFYEWGRWVNGGAWLTIAGQRVDFIYRNSEQVERVIAEASAGRYELDYLQQPPFGFFSAIYLGEIEICIPLHDPEARLTTLKSAVALYPEALRRTTVQDFLWMAEFGLALFARKFAARGDTFGTASCLTRAIHQMQLALFALNRKYPVNDKTMTDEIMTFEIRPRDFGPRVQEILGELGRSPVELNRAVDAVSQIFQETADFSEGLYRSRYAMPG